MSRFLFICEPFILKWQEDIRGSEDPSFNFQTLQMRLEAQGFDPSEAVLRWKTNAVRLSSVEDELILLLLKLGRTNRWFPKNAKPIKAAFIFSLIYKGYLQKQITSQKEAIDLDLYVSTHIVNSPQESPDFLHLQKLRTTTWDRYLLELFSEESSRDYLMDLTHLPQHLIRKEKTELWNKLNTM